MFETMMNPAMIAMVGPSSITVADKYTLGAMYAQEMLLFCVLVSYAVSSIHVVMRTRKEESDGILELIRSFVVGRQANSLSVILEMLLVNGLIALIITLGLVIFSLDFYGAVLFGLSIGMAGMMGSAIALLSAQIMPNSSSANSLSLAVLGILYLLRGVSDVSLPILSYFNPLGWLYLSFPFTLNQGSVLLLSIIFALGTVSIAFYLENKRDLGASYLPDRSGKASASKFLKSYVGLTLNLNKALIVTWLMTLLIFGVAYGSIYGDMQGFLESNDLLQAMFTLSGVSLEASFTLKIVMVLVCFSLMLPIALVNRIYVEEYQGRLSSILAMKVSRSKVYWAHIIIASICGILGLVLSIIGLGLLATTVADTSMRMGDFYEAIASYVPFILFIVGLSGLCLGYTPKFIKYIYIYVCFVFVIGYFGDLLNLPEVLMGLSLTYWLPDVPIESFSTVSFLTVCVCSFVMMFAGNTAYRKRDLVN